ncbi:hypothetical protein K3495_g6104 [Podosphaera aphanis]|nr:hypothetical protein K3495_g6104 [Podosphaera aphanis]
MVPGLTSLPPLVPFPETEWITHLAPTEWEACLDSWILLAGAHLSLSTSEFEESSLKDDSLPVFIVSYIAQVSSSNQLLSSTVESSKLKLIRKMCFLLSQRLLEYKNPPRALLCWEFLSDASKVFGRSHGRELIKLVRSDDLPTLELSMTSLKTQLVRDLDAGDTEKLEEIKGNLKKLNHLLFACHKTAAFFMAGSDFLDALVTGYKLMNPPLRKVILSTLYLCLIGLTGGEKPNISSLVDQLYSLKLAAEAHQARNPHANDTILSELVTVTPILKKIKEKLKKSNNSGPNRIESILILLENFRKPGANVRKVRRPVKTKIDKGKSQASNPDNYSRDDQAQVQRMSLITQVQDLLPDLGPGFISKLLEEYDNNIEVVISHLLEGSLPAHLEKINRAAPLDAYQSMDHSFSRKTDPILPKLPSRHNVFDNDDIDQLALNTSRLHFGRQNNSQTAETILNDRSSAPSKAAILSALAAFDADDDERDDTYDISDVGGTVDSACPENDLEVAQAATSSQNSYDEILFHAFKADPQLFARDAATRRGDPRQKLKKKVGLTDEAIEGWALMISRDQRLLRKLEAKFGGFSGVQADLAASAWKAGDDVSQNLGRAENGSESIHGHNRGCGGERRGTTRGMTRGTLRGTARGTNGGENAGRETIIARRGKETNKGSRANHNRRDQRAKKMARGFSS